MKGITKMTREKHRFSGYMVRAQRKGNGFRMYVSASATQEKGNFNQRMAKAKEKAKQARVELLSVIDDERNWTKKNTLTPQALRFLKGVGFVQHAATKKTEKPPNE